MATSRAEDFLYNLCVYHYNRSENGRQKKSRKKGHFGIEQKSSSLTVAAPVLPNVNNAFLSYLIVLLVYYFYIFIFLCSNILIL